MYIAATSQKNHGVSLYSTTTGRQSQVVKHPRPVVDMIWRRSPVSSRDDLILYTVTSDSVLRIFFPVLDAPHFLQLHASIDLYSSIPFSVASQYRHPSRIFWLDREILNSSLNNILKDLHNHEESSGYRRLCDIRDEGWDMFLRVLEDGSIIVSAVANIDRKPPTLLRQFTLQHSAPSLLYPTPSYLLLLPNPKDPASLNLVTSYPLRSYTLSPLAFVESHSESLRLDAGGTQEEYPTQDTVLKLVRTPNGRGLGVLRTRGGGQVWAVPEGKGTPRLSFKGDWTKADQVVVLHAGETFATYNALESTLTLHANPPSTITGLPSIDSLFTMPSEHGLESIFAVASDFSIYHILAEPSPDNVYQLRLHSHSQLPLSTQPKMIISVDPMAWSSPLHRKDEAWTKRDALLSVTPEGELAFWIEDDAESPSWHCTGRVRTHRTNIRKARCSSIKKSALVVSSSQGEELTIWDSHESEFASGMEFCCYFEEEINDLDWTSTPDSQSILAVGFLHHIELYHQQRMNYFDDPPGWAMCHKIDISNTIPYTISDSIWLVNGTLLIAAGHHLFLYATPTHKGSESLFEYVVKHNGPLMDYHPQMMLQCKLEIVKEIIVNLANDVKRIGQDGSMDKWTSLPVERFLKNEHTPSAPGSRGKNYSFLFDEASTRLDVTDEGFSRPLVSNLLEALEKRPLPHLSPNEHDHLLVLIQATLEVEEQRRALDANGLRYLTTMRSFFLLNRRASEPNSPQSTNRDKPRKIERRERLRYRDIVWAFYSESQDLLLHASTKACGGKMGWADARALGVPIWVCSIDTLKTQMETIARNEYMAGDNRDPTACSLFYFALGKVKLVHGLWRQAAWHKEQAMMLKFLSNDFTQARWKTAALKNAYALLGKQRYDYAAAFFLLGGALKDAINVCVKQLSDFQLAIAIARVVEQSNEGPVFFSILNNTVLPLAFKDGNRWLACWAFWSLHRRDLAVRILVTPLADIASELDIVITDIGEPHYDDTSLALLFSQLRSKTLQAAQGTSEISGRAEFNFVLQIARVFCRMGCHVLALDLVRSWSFERPSTITHQTLTSPLTSERPDTLSRRSMFALEPAMRRRSSIIIDMDIPSLPPTRLATPSRERHPTEPTIPENPGKDEGDFFARKAGIGNLMKSAKHDVQVPDFDMGAFF
ncbi:hypothetical protein ONZ45_g3052 [Pleurotus djamor]|nr:hypothetical protein ONZ45_g3052 [Pleurotus djamor]